MVRSWMGKPALVAAVFAVLLVPLNMISSLVGERAERRQAAQRELADSGHARQVLAGLVLTRPVVEEFEEVTGQGTQRQSVTRRIEHRQQLFPETSEITGRVQVESRQRGIFKLRVYQWEGRLEGEFDLRQLAPAKPSRPGGRITVGTPFVSLMLSDARGLIGTPQLHWHGQPLAVQRGSQLAGAGVHARLPEGALESPAPGPGRVGYSMSLMLRGSDALAFVPLATTEKVSLDSNWPHPSYGGQFLPLAGERNQAGAGSSAQWVVSALSSEARQQLLTPTGGPGQCGQLACADRLEARFIDPVDVYVLSDRSIKYGFLFIGLTFVAFILLEALRRLSVHPAQYLLVGLALATFFLLLLALSEHMAFGLAYGLGTLACASLLAAYLAGVMKSRRLGAAFGAGVALLYAALYVLLSSEDYALLLGALLIFFLLAAAMLLTRHLDWRGFGNGFNNPTGKGV